MAIDVALLLFAVLQVGVDAGVGGVGGFGGAVAVVGQRHVQLAGAGVDAAPLGPVHLGGPHGIGGQAGEHAHIGLGGELEA